MTGEELKKLRIASGLTQKKLGLLLGYKETTAERVVQLWEYGKQPIPIRHWKLLCKILNVKLDIFLPE